MYNSSVSSARTLNLIHQLSQWAKKPNLDTEPSATLDTFITQLHEETQTNLSLGYDVNNINYSEVGLFLQEYGIVYVKKVDLLCKLILQLNTNLQSLLSNNNENKIEIPNIQNNNEPAAGTSKMVVSKIKKTKTKELIKKQKEGPIVPQIDSDTDPTSELVPIPEIEKEHLITLNLPNGKVLKFPVKNIPEDKIQELKSLDWELGPLEDSIDAFGSDHPLYTIFNCIGSETDTAKKIFTFNNISLSGLSWNTLYMLEKRLNRPIINSDIRAIKSANVNNVEEDNENEHFSAEANGQDNLNINSQDCAEDNTQRYDGDNAQRCDGDNAQRCDGDNAQTCTEKNPQACAKENVQDNEPVNMESEENDDNYPDSGFITEEPVVEPNTKELEPYVEPMSDETLNHYVNLDKIPFAFKQVQINLLRLPNSILRKKSYFKLSSEYITHNPKTERVRVLRKRKEKLGNKKKDEAESPTKKPKTVNALSFEEFCYTHFENEGLVPPRVSDLEPNRKSIDARSEMSYGCPVTPDSGHFSMSFLSGDESELADLTDHEPHATPNHQRIDSGLSMSCHDYHTDQLPDGHDHTDNEDGHEHTEHDDTGHISDHDHTYNVSYDPTITATNDLNTLESTNEQQSDPAMQTLKNLFPTVFSDPKTVEVVKELIDPLDKERSENFSQWQKFIDEKTANAQEFNIHEYGTNILEAFPTKTKGEVISFRSVVGDKSVGDMARYFVSTLQLANTYNIELSEQIPGSVEPDSLQLKFLSKDRPHEDFDQIETPSEEHFYNRLSSMQSQEFLQSTPNTTFLKTKLNVTSTYDLNTVKRRRIQYPY